MLSHNGWLDLGLLHTVRPNCGGAVPGQSSLRRNGTSGCLLPDQGWPVSGLLRVRAGRLSSTRGVSSRVRTRVQRIEWRWCASVSGHIVLVRNYESGTSEVITIARGRQHHHNAPILLVLASTWVVLAVKQAYMYLRTYLVHSSSIFLLTNFYLLRS